MRTRKSLLLAPAVVVVDSYIAYIVLETEETTVAQRFSHRLIKKCQLRSWPQRDKKVNGSHHGDSSLLKSTGIQMAAKFLSGPTTREHHYRFLFFFFCMESTSYIFPFRMMFFYLVTTGWIFDISICDNSNGNFYRRRDDAFGYKLQFLLSGVLPIFWNMNLKLRIKTV